MNGVWDILPTWKRGPQADSRASLSGQQKEHRLFVIFHPCCVRCEMSPTRFVASRITASPS
jgi:hypothetical protein